MKIKKSKLVYIVLVCFALTLLCGCTNNAQKYVINSYDLIMSSTESNKEEPIIKDVTLEFYAPYEEKTIKLTEGETKDFLKDFKKLEFSFDTGEVKEASISKFLSQFYTKRQIAK